MSVRVAVITPASIDRLAHLHRQRRFLREAQTAGLEIVRIEAWLDEEMPPAPPGVQTVHVPPGPHGMRVGAARNAAARVAVEHDVDLLVFLDVDCLSGSALLARYLDAARDHPDDLLCGPVTYLESVQRPATLDDLDALTRPHPVRPLPQDGTVVEATDREFDLFWSLSFAVTPATWARLGGFDERYEGYGAEDTDLGRRARSLGIRLQWVGGAHAYHQWHPAGSPPWRHLDDILRNGALFAERWGEWPMGGWIDAFVDAGAVEAYGDGYRRVPSA
ncbi:galactosyltransferase-related protein [Microbacterium sp. W4I20]|uniref:galactosyltransferase-related protein n=1 Tax=Microbacterium sp. W4I20 TaxID=3042262 RepID=UPI0027874199|nr:galactosyltransferase-related protein [Microbacterium sp. W4I20]MDQ0727571.1 N-acetylglucosaminyl-diphospho-decaprenol L-rhamnosyltransferase [Microbacterium sp. W4I20]